MNIMKINKPKNSTDKLYIVRCVQIPTMFTSGQFLPILRLNGFFEENTFLTLAKQFFTVITRTRI